MRTTIVFIIACALSACGNHSGFSAPYETHTAFSEEVPQPDSPDASPGPGYILLTWEPPDSLGPFVTTHIYRNTREDFATATKIGTARLMFSDRTVERETRYWYWIRWESDEGVLSAESASVQATRWLTAEEVSEEIRDSPLLKELSGPITSPESDDTPTTPVTGVSSKGSGGRSTEHAPVVMRHDQLHVGANASPRRRDGLDEVADHRGFSVSAGTVAEGIHVDRLIAYLRDDAEANGGHLGRFGSPPVVRVVSGVSGSLIDETAHAIRIINAYLPAHWQLELSSTPAERGDDKPPSGEIVVDFNAAGTWRPAFSTAAGKAVRWEHLKERHTDAARVYIDPLRARGEARLVTIVHELLHALGRYHPDREAFPGSVMNTPAWGITGHLLHRLDGDALLAVYGSIAPDTLSSSIAEELGEWAHESTHLLGEIKDADVSFGVAHRNGLSQPWASGSAPDTDLRYNHALRGTARWEGRLLGFTPTVEPVAGDAAMSINLRTLTGDLDFTGLETWRFRRAPGTVGSGIRWNDGSLAYDIKVDGNTFVQTGGDNGTVTGAFFGELHEAAGGVLERSDLSAAFGATRQLNPEPEPEPDTSASDKLGETGTARRAGVASYSHVQIGGRFPGTFTGMRPVYAIDNWGFWAQKGGATVFKVFIEEDDSFFSIDEYALRVEGTPTGSNPVSGSVVWTGSVRAYDAHPETLGTPVSGDARLEADLLAATVDVSFTDFTGGHADMAWSGLRMTNGAFIQRSGYTSISGTFYGTAHEGVAGKFSRDRLDGVFGALRE